MPAYHSGSQAYPSAWPGWGAAGSGLEFSDINQLFVFSETQLNNFHWQFSPHRPVLHPFSTLALPQYDYRARLNKKIYWTNRRNITTVTIQSLYYRLVPFERWQNLQQFVISTDWPALGERSSSHPRLIIVRQFNRLLLLKTFHTIAGRTPTSPYRWPPGVSIVNIFGFGPGLPLNQNKFWSTL